MVARISPIPKVDESQSNDDYPNLHPSGFIKDLRKTYIDDILKAMKRGEVTIAVMADFSKAFDTVAYETSSLV